MTLALVVDDLEENRYFLETLLSAQGWRVQTAQHGEEALAKARASRNCWNSRRRAPSLND